MMKRSLLFLGLAATTGASAETTWKPYGFLLPNITAISSGVESFSQPNSSAFTAAGNPVFRKGTHDGQTSFQVAQSRIGTRIEQSENVFGVLEFDFIDFTKASPTTAALPRVRRAFVQWGKPDSWTFRFGQDWDLISGVNPITYNFVGHYFQTGDAGFMRLQLTALKKSGNWEHGFAIGLPAQNSGSTPNGIETSIAPTVAFRETWSFKSARLGFSALGSSLRLDARDPKHVFAGTANVFAEVTNSSGMKFIGKAYVAQNSSNIGMLGLAYANLTHPQMREAGGFFTFKAPLNDRSAVFGGAGMSFMVNPSSMLSSYATAAGGLTSTGPGIESNSTMRLGYERNLEKNITGFMECSYLVTRHHLTPSDSLIYSSDQKAAVVNVGAQYSF